MRLRRPLDVIAMKLLKPIKGVTRKPQIWAEVGSG
jgi:hypothetical protein